MHRESARAPRILTSLGRVCGTPHPVSRNATGPRLRGPAVVRRCLRACSGDVAELLGLREGLQLLERLVLDLADALARHVERAADLVERAGMLAAEAVTQLEHPALAVGEVLERLAEGFLREDLRGALVR